MQTNLSTDNTLYLYMADRSPTGCATAVLCTLESGVWGYTPVGQRTRCACVDGEKLYATEGQATLAARFRWRCNGSNMQELRAWHRPTPALIVTVVLDGRTSCLGQPVTCGGARLASGYCTRCAPGSRAAESEVRS
jgi:hypothetical protein